MKLQDKLINAKDKFFSFMDNKFKKHPVMKFSFILLVIIGYFVFVSMSYGLKDGFFISILTWSFFVLCTPIADAGVLIDFPMRVIAGVKMFYSEMMVWAIAISLNLFTYFTNPQIYESTILLSLLKHILDAPFPYWIVILLSAIGTFLSVYIGDTLIDTKRQTIEQKEQIKKHVIKHKILIFTVLIIFVLIFYDFLLHNLGISIPLI